MEYALPDLIIISVEGADDGVARFTSLVRARGEGTVCASTIKTKEKKTKDGNVIYAKFISFLFFNLILVHIHTRTGRTSLTEEVEKTLPSVRQYVVLPLFLVFSSQFLWRSRN